MLCTPRPIALDPSICPRRPSASTTSDSAHRLRHVHPDPHRSLGHQSGRAHRPRRSPASTEAYGHGLDDHVIADRLGDTDDPDYARRHRRNSRRQPHPRHADDHGLRSRRLHDPRHAAHATAATRPVGSSTASPSPTPRSAPTSARRSTPRTLTRLRPSAAAIRPTSATAPTASSTSLPRNGFERNHEAELRLTGGNLYTGEAQLSLGDHSAETAWYASAHGLALQLWPRDAQSPPSITTPPTPKAALLSLIRNQTAADQLRLTAPVPPGLLPDSLRSRSQRLGAASGLLRIFRPARRADASATHSSSPTGSTPSRPRRCFRSRPFYHFNQANYDSPSSDFPVATTWHQTSNYVGAQATCAPTLRHNKFSAGLYSFFQARERSLRRSASTTAPPIACPTPRPTQMPGLVEFYFSDQLQLGRYITLFGGERILQSTVRD